MDTANDPRRAARLAREERQASNLAQDAAFIQVKTTIRSAIQRLVAGRRLPPNGPWQTAFSIQQALANTPGILVRQAQRLTKDGNKAQVIIAGLRAEDLDLGRGKEPWLSLSCDRLLFDRRRAMHLVLHGHLLVHAHAQKRFFQRQEKADYQTFCHAMLTALPSCALIAIAWPQEGDVIVPVPGGAFLGQRLFRPFDQQYNIQAYQIQEFFSHEIAIEPTRLDRPGGRIRLELRTFLPQEALTPEQEAVVAALSKATAAHAARAEAVVAFAWTLLFGDMTNAPNPVEIEAAIQDVANVYTSPDWAACAHRRAYTLVKQTLIPKP